MNTIRVILATVAKYDWQVHQMDVKSAYLHGEIEEEIFMEQPKGFEVEEKDHYV